MKPKSKKPTGKTRDKLNNRDGELALKITSFGITAERANSLAQTVGKHRSVQKYLRETRHRFLTFELLDAPESEKKAPRMTPQDRLVLVPKVRLWEQGRDITLAAERRPERMPMSGSAYATRMSSITNPFNPHERAELAKFQDRQPTSNLAIK